jgi:hypothetical protein
MNYVLLCYESPANFAARTDPLKKDTFWSAMDHYLKALKDAGVLVGGAGLQTPEMATFPSPGLSVSIHNLRS